MVDKNIKYCERRRWPFRELNAGDSSASDLPIDVPSKKTHGSAERSALVSAS